MALGLPKIILAGSNNTTNSAGAYFQNANITVNTAGANANIVIPAGVYIANTPANCTIWANLGSNVQIVAANATAPVLISDGINVYANTTTNGTLVLVTVNGGQAASGTFNS